MICTPQKIKMLKIDEISPNPYQSRRNFNAKTLKELSFSIREVGLISPIVVRTTLCGYELICGERRLRAAMMAQMKEIPAIVVRAGDKECATLSLIENLQRDDISMFEEGEAFFNLMSYHGIKKEKLAKKVSLENSKITEKVRLLGISPEIRYKIEEKGVTEKTAREILKLHSEEKQLEILEKISEEELGEKETAKIVRETLREMARNKNGEKRKGKNKMNLSVYINTVKQTLELLRKNGAEVSFSQTEDEKSVNFTFRINK